MDIQQAKALVGQTIRMYPCVMSYRVGKLLDIQEAAGPRGENLFLVDCGNLRFRLLDWRIGSMTDQTFDEGVQTNEDGSVSLGERPAVYAGKKSRRAKAKAEKPVVEQKAKAEPAAREEKTCRCGCGGKTFSLFVPGHDARVKSQLLKVARGQLVHSDVNQSVWDLVESNEKWSALYENCIAKANTEAEAAAQAAEEADNASEGDQPDNA